MEVELINKNDNIFNDNIGFVEQWDFSKANVTEESRINAITQVASICYQNPKALNSDSLYNRLMAESMGLPSSSFEFVPVLLTAQELLDAESDADFYQMTNIEKYGEWIDGKYILTNFRAVIYDKEKYGIDFTKRFNTKEECKIIAKHFKVFQYKVDLSTRAQMVRHRVNWQELSRRYVSGKKKKFEFYESKKLDDVEFEREDSKFMGLSEIYTQLSYYYYQAIDSSIKPEEARRILPQAMYTQIWGAFQPTQLDNFYKLRLDKHAQKEIRWVAEAMKELERK